MEFLLQWLQGGWLQWPLAGIVAYVLATTHVTIIAVTLYLHRSQAHHALRLHPWLSHGCRFWLWLTTGMVTRAWVAVHRKHHAQCERAGDPHSPQVFGLWRVLTQGTELYQREARCPATLARYGAGTPDDWLERHLYARYVWQGVGLLLLIDLALFGVLGATAWAIQMLWIPVCAAGLVNGLGHARGYRNFDLPNAATNLLPWGLFIGGEELHNNHHAFPTAAKLSWRWFECDIGWAYVCLLRGLGLVQVRAIAPILPPPGAPATPDATTLAAFHTYRYPLARAYGIMVVRAGRALAAGGGQAERRVVRLFRREPGRLNPSEQASLAPLLARDPALATLQAMRLELACLWEQRGGAPDLLPRLADWCERAEAAGIPALRQFASRLRSLGAVGCAPGSGKGLS
ncbi:fatty acid desaturase [Massilia sp. TS11]|uniref:DesA family fatty acid desaturase n=1 Tax=Massilia sp. TS11 TaxID=2908003 RepID=UPI001EDC706D|nr:fatty acid desaturase [Massilia sp. TS11]MCG2586112.1 fatty acid desaturase [Massilia sp. TS11]